MNRVCFFLLLSFVSFQNYTVASTREFRITQNGGSIDKQISQLLNVINGIPGSEPITIKVEEGYYSITNSIVIKDCRHPIELLGGEKKSTIISGSVRIEEWVPFTNGLWKCKIPNEYVGGYLPDQLFVNGKRAQRSRTPNTGVYYVNEVLQKESIYGIKLKKEEIESIPFITKNEKPIITLFRKWTSSKRYLSGVSVLDRTLTFGGKRFPSENNLVEGNGVIIENTIGAIDSPGEWCADGKGYIYYLPREGEMVMREEFRIPVVEKILLIENSNNICIKNIVFEHTTLHIPDLGLDDIQAGSISSAAVEVDNADNISFEDCEFRNISNYGLWFRYRCTYSSVKRTFFHNLGGGGVKIGSIYKSSDLKQLTRHILVENNIIHNYGQFLEGSVGIGLFNASNCKIIHNDIHYGNYTGISLGWVWGYGDSPSKKNEVAFNRISHVGDGRLYDLAGIYTLGRSEGTIVHHNVVSDISSGNQKEWGLYADEGTTGVLFEKNLVYNCTSGPFFQNYGSDNKVTNNIFAWGRDYQISYSSDKGEKPLIFSNNIIIMKTGDLMYGYAINTNMFYVRDNCYWSISSVFPKVGDIEIFKWIEQRESTSIFEDPNFRDPVNYDFRFKKSSVCKKIGFKKFNYKKAGVYGNRKWKKMALNPSRAIIGNYDKEGNVTENTACFGTRNCDGLSIGATEIQKW